MIYLMLSYARSGGTLLNRCLGSFDEVVMLSEINPMDNGNRRMDAPRQCRSWYGIDVHNTDFKGIISECNDWCNAHNKKLIVRDWSTVNFRKMDKNHFSPPNRFLIIDELKEVDDLKIFTLVRDPIDVFICAGSETVALEGYARFVKEAMNIKGNKIIKYEDLCRSPNEVMKDLCDYIGIPYSEEWRLFYRNTKATGDIDLKAEPRNRKKELITLPRRKRISAISILEVNQSVYLREVNSYLNYLSSYHDGAEIEKNYDRLRSYLGSVRFRLTSPGSIALKGRKSLRILLNHIYRPYALKRMARPDAVSIYGCNINTSPEVFHPILFHSTKILASEITTAQMKGKRVLDMGTGTGAIGILAARQGASVTAADINPSAVELSRNNAQNNSVEMNVVQSDLYSSLDGKKYDAIFFNIPFYPKIAHDMSEEAFNAGESFSTVVRFAQQSVRHLADGGTVMIVFSEVSGYRAITDIFYEAGFVVRRSKVRQAFFEKFFIVTFSMNTLSGKVTTRKNTEGQIGRFAG